MKTVAGNKRFGPQKSRPKSFEVNRRLVYSMRSLGKGQSGAKKFCTLMNMPPHLKQLPKQLKALQRKVCLKLPLKLGGDAIVNTGVSCDGTWQRRGFSSLNGCVAVIISI